MNAPVVFAVSTGRTGTSFLASAFRELGVDAHHEPGPRLLQSASHARASGHLSHRRALALLERTRPRLFDHRDRPYLEASLHLYGLVDVVLREIPDADVVHLVRDPRTYARSAMIWGVHRWDGRPQNVLPFRRLSPAHERPWNLLVRGRWALTGQLERICWSWAAVNRTIRLQGEGHPRYTRIRFEDLFDDVRGPAVLGDLAGRLGLDPSVDDLRALVDRTVNPATRKEGRPHPSRRTEYPRWEEWTPKQREMLRRHCAEEAAHLGYELDT